MTKNRPLTPEYLKGKDVTVNALHHGSVDTNIWDLWREKRKWYYSILHSIIRLFLIYAEEGVQTTIYLAESNEVKGITDKYFAQKKMKKVSTKCSDTKL